MKRQGQQTTGSQLRVAVYRRVSREEQAEGYSWDAQSRAAALYCTSHNWTIVREYADEGRSAWTDIVAKRPGFAQMLQDAELGLFDVVLVHKLDRFARNILVTLETLKRLEGHRVAFVSIAENMDFTTPIGKVILATLAAFAEYYSANLSFETKKGKAERKAQGLPNGLLPFGVKKSGLADGATPNGSESVVPDPDTYPGLLLAFRLAAEGKSDREVAAALNADGYRTTGNRGRNPFTKDTVCRLLKNRFYVGELPDGNGGWVAGAHPPLLDLELFERAQEARAANQTANASKVNRRHRRYSLSGLALCGTCGGRLHFHTDRRGHARVYCYQERQGKQCGQRSAALEGIEAQLAAYLATFSLPEETVTQIVHVYDQTSAERDDTEVRRREVAGRLERIKQLFKWGDLDVADYRVERDTLEAELAGLRATTHRSGLLAQAATFLRDLPAAWEAATAEQRNSLAQLVFQSVEIKDDRVVAVVPQPDFAPFFMLKDGVGSGGGGNESGQPLPAALDSLDSALAGGSDGGRLRRFRTRTSSFHPMRSGWGNGVWSWIGTARLVEGSSPSGSRRPRVLP